MALLWIGPSGEVCSKKTVNQLLWGPAARKHVFKKKPGPWVRSLVFLQCFSQRPPPPRASSLLELHMPHSYSFWKPRTFADATWGWRNAAALPDSAFLIWLRNPQKKTILFNLNMTFSRLQAETVWGVKTLHIMFGCCKSTKRQWDAVRTRTAIATCCSYRVANVGQKQSCVPDISGTCKSLTVLIVRQTRGTEIVR